MSIKTLAYLIKDIVGFQSKILFDSTKPDGAPRKLMDITKLNSLGWKYIISLEEGIQQVYKEKFHKE